MKARGWWIAAALLVMSTINACSHQLDRQIPISETQTGDGVLLTILTSENPETQLMALVLTKAALERGETPRILLCSAAGDLALKAPPASATTPLAPKDISPQGLLQSLMANGVKVDVCAIYLPNRPFGPEALLGEVGVAIPSDVVEQFTSENATVLSF